MVLNGWTNHSSLRYDVLSSNMIPHPTSYQIIEQFLWHLFRAMHEGSTEVVVRGYLVYQTIWFTEVVPHSRDEISVVVSSVERVNLRWPGAFRPRSAPLPIRQDKSEVIWVFDSRCLWPTLRGVWPFFEDVLAVAVGPEGMAKNARNQA